MRYLLLTIIFYSVNLLFAQSPQWQQRADFGSFGRHRGAGVAIGNKAYVGTGHLNGTGIDTWYADWWEYDPATNAWTQKSDYPGNNGNGDQDIVAVAIGDYGYCGLGQIDGSSFYRYDPQTNQWTQMVGPPASSNFNNTFPFNIGDKAYFPTLYSSFFFEYDPATNSWTQLGNLPFSTVYGIPTFAINDYGYIKNGAAFYQYNPSTDSWTPKAAFPGMFPNRPRGIHQNNFGYFIGGYAGSPSVLPWIWGAEVWRYDPMTDTWLQMADFPGTTRRWAVVVNVNERVYYGLGTNGTNFHDWWEFSSTGSFDELSKDDFNTFPVPASLSVNFTSTTNFTFEVYVYNQKGQRVSTLKTQNGYTTLNRGNLPSGNYYYQILIDGMLKYSDHFIFE